MRANLSLSIGDFQCIVTFLNSSHHFVWRIHNTPLFHLIISHSAFFLSNWFSEINKAVFLLLCYICQVHHISFSEKSSIHLVASCIHLVSLTLLHSTSSYTAVFFLTDVNYISSYSAIITSSSAFWMIFRRM